MSELVDPGGVSAVAGASGLAVEDHLGTETELREGVVAQDVDAVRQGRGGSVRPAGAAVDRNVLVARPREVVHSAHVAPVPGRRNCC